MLRSFLITVVVVSAVLCDFYNPRYDDFDIQPLLENDRILIGYIKCFLDQGPCTAEAKDFKKVIPEALQSTCAKCSPKQKELIRTVIKTLMQRHPEMWDELVKTYDGEEKYRENLKKFFSDD